MTERRLVEVEHVIIGAGLAGLVLRHFLRARDVVLLDPAPFGYKIGESVVPEQFGHPELRALVPAVHQLPSHTLKLGTTFISDGSVASFPLPPAEAGVSMHVARSELEELIARTWGVPIVRERVVSVDVAAHRVETETTTYRSSGPILDCSGPAMLVATALGEVEKLFPTSATWAYWDVVDADAARFQGAIRASGRKYLRYDAMRRAVLPDPTEHPDWAPQRTTILTRLDDATWTWQIPLFKSKLLSYGAISRGEPIDDVRYREIARAHAAPGFVLAERGTEGPGPYDRVHRRAGFARRARRPATLDYVLLADAYAFADPVYSVGTALAVNKAIEVAEALTTTGWTEAACARYVESTELLLGRAMAAFDLWYRGDVLRSDAAAAEVQRNFLTGTAFQVAVAEHYGNVSTDVIWHGDDSPRAAAARETGRTGIGVDVRASVATLSGGERLAGWMLASAATTRDGLLLRWQRDGRPDLDVRLAFDARQARAYRIAGTTALSYESLFAAEYPFGPDVAALLDELVHCVTVRENDWRSVWRLAIPSVGAAR